MELAKHLNQKELMGLCEWLDFPQEVNTIISRVIQQYDFSKLAPHFPLLFQVSTGEEAVKRITAELEGNPDGQWIWLAVYLSAALYTKEHYREKGIPDSVFRDTMRGCFRLFLYEHRESYGTFGFDRAYWPFRHISMHLFRLGTLSFEMRKWKDEDVLSVHIPSDSNLTEENCLASYRNAIQFFEKYFPYYQYEKFVCSSWLLSPSLRDLLSEDSNIIKFQSRYTISDFDEENESYKLWLFKRRDCRIEEFPQNTSLQRKAKQYLVNGGKIGAATGWFSAKELLM